MTTYYAHTSGTGSDMQAQTLESHLEGVSRRASVFLRPMGLEEYGAAAGQYHDRGKASPEFQGRLMGSKVSVDHALPGAQALALQCAGGCAAAILVPAILGHHRGIPNAGRQLGGTLEPLEERIKESGPTVDEEFLKRLSSPAPLDSALPEKVMRNLGPMLDRAGSQQAKKEVLRWALFFSTRMVHSALVDADWLDTEEFCDPESAAKRSEAVADSPTMGQLLGRLDDYRKAMFGAPGADAVSRARNKVLSDCKGMAPRPTGLFSLEVPTGGGKTLSSLEFAIRHARANGLDRIIYAVPYTSIVEQTAAAFRTALGDDAVLEHHSSVNYCEMDEERALRQRQLIQNWDAPLVVTTNVQLFESLFSNRPGKSRKVHNAARSVVILDEVQTLPDSLLKPTLAMLEALCAIGGSSVVLCSATQPGLGPHWPFKSVPVQVTDPAPLRRALDGRVVFEVDRIGDNRLNLDELVGSMTSARQALCVVNTKGAARRVFRALADTGLQNVYHLSTSMTALHRSRVIEAVRGHLKQSGPCYVVSTQLIEAGVDIDFPLVLRELTGIDSIVQAAGRCNREGTLLDARGNKIAGTVRVFECEELEGLKQSDWMGELKSLGRTLVREMGPGALGDKGVQRYFDLRHDVPGGLDSCLTDGRSGIFQTIVNESTTVRRPSGLPYATDHEAIARAYRFIDDEDGFNIFIPFEAEGEEVLEAIERNPFDKALLNAVQRGSVTVRSWDFKDIERFVREVGPWKVLETGWGAPGLYDEHMGLLPMQETSVDVLID